MKKTIKNKFVPVIMSFTLFFISFTTQARAAELEAPPLEECPNPFVHIVDVDILEGIVGSPMEAIPEQTYEEPHEEKYSEEVMGYQYEENYLEPVETPTEVVSEFQAEVIPVDLPYGDTVLPADIIQYTKVWCEFYDLDLDIMLANFYHESRFKRDIENDSGCKGLGQIKVRCHQARMEKLGVADIFDAESNIKVSCDYVHELLMNHNGDYEEAFIDYNGSRSFTRCILKTAENNKQLIDLVR